MNTDIIAGKWKEIKGKVRNKWGNFTEDEINQMQGTQEELEGALQKKYGYAKDEAIRQVRSFMDEYDREDKNK